MRRKITMRREKAPRRTPGCMASVVVWPDLTGDAYIGGVDDGIAHSVGSRWTARDRGPVSRPTMTADGRIWCYSPTTATAFSRNSEPSLM